MTDTAHSPEVIAFAARLANKHEQYLPAFVDYYTCGECNKHLPGGEVQAWPCPIIRELVAEGLYPESLAKPDPAYLELKYGIARKK